jgi:ABC-type lipoprotein release transport system permease subunit
LDLTTQEPQNNLTSKRTKLIIAISVVIVLIVIIAIIKGLSSKSDHAHRTENGMPALKVVVTNGCGYDKLASEFAESLNKKNIEVVELTDTPKPIYDKSIIVVRKGDMQDLQRLQTMTGITRYTVARSDEFPADFEIIVGKDYEDFIK